MKAQETWIFSNCISYACNGRDLEEINFSELQIVHQKVRTDAVYILALSWLHAVQNIENTHTRNYIHIKENLNPLRTALAYHSPLCIVAVFRMLVP